MNVGAAQLGMSRGASRRTRAAMKRGAETDLHLLSNELARISSENQNSWTVFASLLGVTLVAGSGFIALDGKPDAAAWIWAVLALLPALVLAYVVAMFSQQVMRSYYARGIERRIMEIDAQEHGHALPAAQALESFNAVVSGNRRGFGELRFINWLEYGLITTVFIGASIFGLVHVEPLAFKLATAAVVAFVILASALAARRSIMHGSAAYYEAMERLTTELCTAFPLQTVKRDSRRLISYLLLPRRNEFLVKAVMLHLTSALVGVWLARDAIGWSSGVRSALLSFVAFEFLLYQARYMVNDYQGRGDDAGSPSRDARGRLPQLDPSASTTAEESKVRRAAFFIVLLGRSISALLVPLLLPGKLGIALVAAMALCLVFALVYENLRRRAHPSRGYALTARYLGIYSVVGTSYAIRVVIGIYLGSRGSAPAALLVSIGACFYALGVATVLMGWALEATEYIVELRQGSHRQVAVAAAVGSKGHLLPLARIAGKLPATAGLESVTLRLDDPSLSCPRPLRDEAILCDSASIRAPWNVLMVVASAAAGLAGCVGAALGSHLALPCAIGGVVVGAAAVRAPKVVSGAVGAALVISIALAVALGRGAFAFLAIPITSVVGTYASVRFMTYRETIGFFKVLRDLPSRLWGRSLVALRALWT